MYIDLLHKNCSCVLGSSIVKATDLETLVRKALKPLSVSQGVFSYVTLLQSNSQLFIDGLICLPVGQLHRGWEGG